MAEQSQALVQALDLLFQDLLEVPVPQPAGRKKRKPLEVDVTQPEVADYLKGVGQSLTGRFQLRSPRTQNPEK